MNSRPPSLEGTAVSNRSQERGARHRDRHPTVDPARNAGEPASIPAIWSAMPPPGVDAGPRGSRTRQAEITRDVEGLTGSVFFVPRVGALPTFFRVLLPGRLARPWLWRGGVLIVFILMLVVTAVFAFWATARCAIRGPNKRRVRQRRRRPALTPAWREFAGSPSAVMHSVPASSPRAARATTPPGHQVRSDRQPQHATPPPPPGHTGAVAAAGGPATTEHARGAHTAARPTIRPRPSMPTPVCRVDGRGRPTARRSSGW